MIEAVIHRLKIETRRPENRLRLGGELKGSLRVAQQDVPLQLQDPVKAGNERNAAPEHSCFERRLVEGRAAPRSAAKRIACSYSGMTSMSRPSRRAHSAEINACLCANVAGQLSAHR